MNSGHSPARIRNALLFALNISDQEAVIYPDGESSGRPWTC